MNKLIRLGLGLAAVILSIYACNLSNNSATPNPGVLAAEASTLSLVKTATNGSDIFNTVEQVINYTYLVKNNGTAALPGPVTVTDNKTVVTCPLLNTIGNNNDALEPTESITCTSAYTIIQADLNNGMVTNNATASVGGVTSNVANAVVNTTASKVLTITTTASPTSYNLANQTITFAYVVKNTGTAAIGPAQFVVTDERIPTPTKCDVPNKTLAPNDIATCSATYTITPNDITAGAIVSRATASGGGAMTLEPATVTVSSQGAGGPASGFTVGSTIPHTVKKGEWLLQISRCYGADFNAVWKANPIVIDPDIIEPDEVLTIPNLGSNGKIYGPPCVVPYTVVSGDTWASIASKFNADVAVLMEANKDVALTAGAVLKIPINSAGSTPANPPPTNGGTRITFPAGATSVTINGTVPAASSVRYLLNATNGQTLDVKVNNAPANEVALGITSPVNAVLKPLNTVLNFNGPITANGDHIIEIAGISGTNSKNFSMEVSLTPTTTTTSPVQRVDDINLGVGDSSPSYLAEFKGVLYFRADGNDGAGGELWKYDGANKPSRVADINNNATGSEPAFLTFFNEALYFRANGNDGAGVELWRYNGAEVGRLNDMNVGGDFNPSYMTVYNGNLYFSANGNDGKGVELWRTDGNTISRAADIYDGPNDSNPSYLTVYNGALYFSALTNNGGVELWKYDGNAPTLVWDINQGVGNSNPAYLTVFNTELYFSANGNDTTGTELWKYNGTTVTRVADINKAGDSIPSYLTVFNGALYFSANGNDGAGFELWKFNGTDPNPSRVTDINKVGETNPSYLTVFKSELYFQADGGDGAGKELWKFKGP